MNDIFAQFLRLLIAISLGIIISCFAGLHKKRGLEWAIATICILTFALVRSLIPLRLFTHGLPPSATIIDLTKHRTRTLVEKNPLDWMHGNIDPARVPQIDMPKPGLPADKFSRYGTTKYPVMGPLDNLNEKETEERLQYLADVARTPYKGRSYLEWRTDADARRSKDGSSLVATQDKQPKDYSVEFTRWWPDVTNELGNARDCTAYEPGHPFSCIQEWPAGNQPSAQQIGPILDRSTQRQLDKFTDLEEQPLTKSVADEYRRVYPKRPIMWRNAPGDVSRNSTRPGWHDICRNCKVGHCLNGICGSRLVEPDNDNILGAEKIIKTYMRDDKSLV